MYNYFLSSIIGVLETRVYVRDLSRQNGEPNAPILYDADDLDSSDNQIVGGEIYQMTIFAKSEKFIRSGSD